MKKWIQHALLSGLRGRLATSGVVAQGAASGGATNARLELALNYQGAYAYSSAGQEFWMLGGGAQLEGRIAHGLGAVVDVAGLHAANIHNSGVNLDMMAALAGPRYNWRLAGRSGLTLFAQALPGAVYGFHSVFPSAAGARESATGLALKCGGGVNYAFSPRLGLRLIEADWLHTQLPNGAENTQNNLFFASGLVIRLR